MPNNLTRSHCTLLRKVATKLAYKQKMDSTQIILTVENQMKMEQAEQLIYKAINLLQNIS